MSLFVYSDPYGYGVFDSFGQVALFAAESLDSRESKLFLQFIGECYADSSHVIYHHFFKHLFGARFARVICFLNRQIALLVLATSVVCH